VPGYRSRFGCPDSLHLGQKVSSKHLVEHGGKQLIEMRGFFRLRGLCGASFGLEAVEPELSINGIRNSASRALTPKSHMTAYLICYAISRKMPSSSFSWANSVDFACSMIRN
jgi:hypothetical protein